MIGTVPCEKQHLSNTGRGLEASYNISAQCSRDHRSLHSETKKQVVQEARSAVDVHGTGHGGLDADSLHAPVVVVLSKANARLEDLRVTQAADA